MNLAPTPILHVLTHNIPPVFAILTIGFIMGRSNGVFALRHGVRTDVFAPVVIWTGTPSLLCLAWLA